MADPPETATPPAKPEETPKGVGKSPAKSPSLPRKCPHCGEMKALGHQPNCAKNPKRGQPKAPKPEGKKPKAGKRAAKKAPAKKNAVADFVDSHAGQLKTDPKAPAPPPPPPADPPKKKGGSKFGSYAAWGLLGLGVLFFAWKLFGPEQGPKRDALPEETAQPVQPQLPPNGYIPGEGPVYIPNLQG